MNQESLNSLQNMVHDTSLVILGLVIAITAVIMARPQFFRKLLREFSDRKYIFFTGTLLSLLCGTIFIATQSEPSNQFVSEPAEKKISATNPTQTTQELAFQSIKIEEKEFPESVPYPKQQQEDDTLTGDQTKLIQAGKDGQKIMIYNVTYDKGKEISRVLKSEKVTVEPVPEITAVGKKTADTDSQKAKKKRIPAIRLNCGNENESERARICLYRD